MKDLVSEWAYSMQDALEKYQNEDNVKYLRDVLNNEGSIPTNIKSTNLSNNYQQLMKNFIIITWK